MIYVYVLHGTLNYGPLFDRLAHNTATENIYIHNRSKLAMKLFITDHHNV